MTRAIASRLGCPPWEITGDASPEARLRWYARERALIETTGRVS